MESYTYLICFGCVIFGFLTALFITPICMMFANYIGMMDRPDGKLKNHETVTPYLGGVAVYISVFLPLIYFMPSLFPGVSLLLCFGLLDDKYRLSPGLLFLGHSLGAGILLWKGYIVALCPHEVVNYAISFFWFVCLINGFNLIDVMDGLAVVAALSSAAILVIYSALLQQTDLLYMSLSILGTLLGFLIYNKPKAKIYLGDAGSLFLGGIFSGLIVRLLSMTGNQYIPIAPLLIPIPFLELIGLIIIRSYKGIPFFKGSPDHFSHYLQSSGLSKNEILGRVFFLSSLTSMLSLALYLNIIHTTVFFGLSTFIVSIWYSYLYFCA